MKVGDVIHIKNPAGLLKVTIEKELCLADVTRGIGDDKLPGFSKPRLEYHKGPYGEHLVTYCGDIITTPFNMYIIHILDYGDEIPKCYLGSCDETEQHIFETKY